MTTPLALTLPQLITICAVVNGLIFSFLLFQKKENRKANRFLSLLILSMCLTFTPYMLDPFVWHQYRWLAWLPFSLSYWIGPSFYFYVKTLTKPSRAFGRKDLWHFSPIVLNYLHSLYHGIVRNSNPWPWFHHTAELLESAAIISILIYMFLSYKVVTKYQDYLLNSVSNMESVDLNWIKRMVLVIASSFILILLFLAISSGLIGMEAFDQWDTFRAGVLVFYAGILYWLSISGYRQAQTVDSFVPLIEQRDEPETSETIRKLQEVLIVENLYKNADLTLQDLSRAVGVSPRSISEAINQELNKNYYQFINEYRVEEIKKKLMDPKNDHLKILSLALDSGFNSKASFNRVFKNYTGLSPKEFKIRNRKP